MGIENEIFYESVVCTNENFDITNKSKLLESLNNQTPSCKEVNFSIFGLSLGAIIGWLWTTEVVIGLPTVVGGLMMMAGAITVTLQEKGQNSDESVS